MVTEAEGSTLASLLVAGGDERILLDPATGRNRYHLDPLDFEGLLHRGSCTMGVMNPRSLAVAEAFVSELESLRSPSSLDALVGAQADRLRSLAAVGPDDGVDVFFAPSGTDLCHLPVLFSRMLAAESSITNIISCPEELGSGSLAASGGRFFSALNQFGDPIDAGGTIDPGAQVSVAPLAARSDDGLILDRREAIRRICEEQEASSIIGNLVYGSKSGITDDLSIIDEPLGGVMWVVDLCQLRVEPELIAALLAKGAMLMVTGSKFFEAPPFAAAMLVPRPWSELLRSADPSAAGPYRQLFSRFDVPPELAGLRSQLDQRANLGLRLRWEIALDEMEAYSKLPAGSAEHCILSWNQAVRGRIESSPLLTLMPDQERTNPSIISFQALRLGRQLRHEELAELHRLLLASRSLGIDQHTDRASIGQPVRYGDRSFLRVAIGSPTVRAMVEREEEAFAADLALIGIIEGLIDQAAAG